MEKFEQRWKEVFEGATVSPADGVWNTIDRTLAYAEGDAMKKRIVLYQRIAAASVLFALLIGSFGIYHLTENRSQAFQNNKSLEKTLPPIEREKIINDKNLQASSELSYNKDELKTASKEAERGNEIASLKSYSNANVISNKPKDSNITTGGDSSNDKSTQQNFSKPIESVFEATNNKGVHLYRMEEFSNMALEKVSDLELLSGPKIHEGPIMVDIVRKLPAIPGVFMVHKEKKATHEQVWASVTAAAGSYNPNINSSSNYSYASLSSTGASAAPVVGTSYSFGMLAGMRVARRVVLQSGIQYLNQSINSTSNISLSNSLAPVASSLYNTTQNYTTTNPYSISSANEFVSVPVQAGYLFIDKKMGLQLNSGVSTDFFIRNTLSDPSGQRQSYSQGAGQDSPYRSVNFSGLLNSEVSYKVGSRYRVSVVPGLHYSFNPVLKSATNFSGNPSVWDVGFRFRYIFK